MDPFEVRMQCLNLLRRLNASQQSIQKVVAYSLKYFSRCGDLIWDCIVEECQKGSLNTRINILYLLDSLCEASLISKASFGPSSSSGGGAGINENLYVDFVTRDLATIVEYVVPPGREGLINLMSTVQILENWRNKRVLDPQKVEEVLTKLESQKSNTTIPQPLLASTSAEDASLSYANAADGITGEADTGSGGESLAFSRNEVFKRIEEDRERHKRLRERRWVQPLVYEKGGLVPVLVSFAPLPSEDELAPAPAPEPEPQPPAINTEPSASTDETNPSTSPNPADANAEPVASTSTTDTTSKPAPPAPPLALELPLDIEFDNAWETTSDWNEDDDDAIAEENALCYPNAAVRYGDNPSAPQSQPPLSSSSATVSMPTSAGSSIPLLDPAVSGYSAGSRPALRPEHGPSSSSAPEPRNVSSRDPRLMRAASPSSAQTVPQKRPFKIDRSRVGRRDM